MSKAGGIIGLIAGIFGFIAAVSTLFFGGLGAALEAEGANSVIGLGWGGIFFSFLVIICAAVVFSRPKGAGIALITSSILGAVLGGTLVACCMALSLVGGILAVLGARKTVPVPAHVNNAGAFESLETTQRVSDSSDVLPQSAPPIKKKRIWIWAVLAAFIGIICIIFFAGKDHTRPLHIITQ